MSDVQTAEQPSATGKAAIKAAADAAEKKVRIPKFNASRDHGKIWSANGHPRAAYEQNGYHYAADGTHIPMAGDAQQAKAQTAAQKKRMAGLAEMYDKKAEAARHGEDPDKITGDDEVDGVDLRAWALRETPYRFGAVRQAIEIKYSRSVHTEHDARDFLVQQKVISPAENKQVKIAQARTR